MTLDEAIEDFRYDAEQNVADLDISFAERNNQIADWLEDYKRLKSETEQDVYEKAYKDGQDKGFSDGHFIGYNKAIDEACEYLKCEWAVDNIHYCTDFDKIAEQLKAGYISD